MENNKEFFKLYPNKKDDYFWKNINSTCVDKGDAVSLISTRFNLFNALEILQAGKDKPILNINGLKEFMNCPANEKYFIQSYKKIYHYLPEQMFRIFVIAFDKDPQFKVANQLANKCMAHYNAHGGDFEFIKFGLYKAVKDFKKEIETKKILEFNQFNVFKLLKQLDAKTIIVKSLYDDVFEATTGVSYLNQDLKNRGRFYNEETRNQIKADLDNGKVKIKDMIKNFDSNMLMNFIKTKKAYLKMQADDLLEKMENIESENYYDDETYFKYQDQIETLENNDNICDFLESLVKETNFTNNLYTDKTKNNARKTPKKEKIITKAD